MPRATKAPIRRTLASNSRPARPSSQWRAPNIVGITWQAGTINAIKFIHNLGKNQPVLIEINRNYPGGSWSPITVGRLHVHLGSRRHLQLDRQRRDQRRDGTRAGDVARLLGAGGSLV